MAEIIKGKFGSPKPKEGSKEKEPSNRPESSDARESLSLKFKEAALKEIERRAEMRKAEKDGDIRFEGFDALVNVGNSASEMMKYLNKLDTGHISTEVLATANQYWKSLTNLELADAFKNSSESDWIKYPGRYKSLLAERARRLDQMRKVFEDQSSSDSTQ